MKKCSVYFSFYNIEQFLMWNILLSNYLKSDWYLATMNRLLLSRHSECIVHQTRKCLKSSYLRYPNWRTRSAAIWEFWEALSLFILRIFVSFSFYVFNGVVFLMKIKVCTARLWKSPESYIRRLLFKTVMILLILFSRIIV